jgi:hypothetical protein
MISYLFYGLTVSNAPRPPHYRGFTMTLWHTTLGRTPLDEWSARRRDLYLTTHNTHDRHPRPRQVSNRQSFQESYRRPTSYTEWPLRSASEAIRPVFFNFCWKRTSLFIWSALRPWRKSPCHALDRAFGGPQRRLTFSDEEQNLRLRQESNSIPLVFLPFMQLLGSY